MMVMWVAVQAEGQVESKAAQRVVVMLVLHRTGGDTYKARCYRRYHDEPTPPLVRRVFRMGAIVQGFGHVFEALV